MPSDRDDRVLVQVVELSQGREIRKLSNVAELLRSRTEDIQQAIVTGSQTVAGSLGSLTGVAGWSLGEVTASFGVTLAAEAGVILSKASAGATLDVTVKYLWTGKEVDEQLGDYHGYSGSGVLDSLGRAVVGILIQQQPLRVPVPLGVAPEAANVLYAVPVRTAVARLGVATSTGPPLRFDVPRPPSGMVDRPELLDRVVGSLTEPGPGEDRPVVRLWGYGGMGKTTLARQTAHDERVWRAFPGGILELSAGEGASVLQVTDQLRTRIATGGRSLPEALSGEPLLVVLDGVLDAGLVGEVVATVPEEVAVVVTTRGTLLEATRVGRRVVSVPVGALSRGEAVRALARDVPRTPEVDEALDRLAAALGRWALLLGQGRHRAPRRRAATGRRSADALAGYLLGSGRGNDPTGHLGTGGWTLPSTLQFVNGFLTALATTTPARAPAVAQEVAGVLERYWPAVP